jgi:hypothetical protein
MAIESLHSFPENNSEQPRIPISAVRSEEGKMPYEEFRKLFEQRPEPNRWQRIRFRTSIKWTLAGGLCVIAVLLIR